MSRRLVAIATAGEIAVLVLLVLDLVADGLGDTAVTVGRGAALVAAFVVAGVIYQGWSVATRRPPALHVAAGVALLGGAFVAAAVFAPPATGEILGTTPFSLLGVGGLVVAVLLAQLSTRSQEKAS